MSLAEDLFTTEEVMARLVWAGILLTTASSGFVSLLDIWRRSTQLRNLPPVLAIAIGVFGVSIYTKFFTSVYRGVIRRLTKRVQGDERILDPAKRRRETISYALIGSATLLYYLWLRLAAFSEYGFIIFGLYDHAGSVVEAIAFVLTEVSAITSGVSFVASTVVIVLLYKEELLGVYDRVQGLLNGLEIK